MMNYSRADLFTIQNYLNRVNSKHKVAVSNSFIHSFVHSFVHSSFSTAVFKFFQTNYRITNRRSSSGLIDRNQLITKRNHVNAVILIDTFVLLFLFEDVAIEASCSWRAGRAPLVGGSAQVV